MDLHALLVLAGAVFDHQLDRAFRALASTNRRWMLERLADGGVSVFELAETFPMSFRGVLQHVEVLERCGLVRTSKQGRVRTCRLDADTLLGAEAWLRHTLWQAHCRKLGSLPQDWPLRGFVERPEGR
jgi:DNA-binding transcriptional ArsR family regulator